MGKKWSVNELVREMGMEMSMDDGRMKDGFNGYK